MFKMCFGMRRPIRGLKMDHVASTSIRFMMWAGCMAEPSMKGRSSPALWLSI